MHAPGVLACIDINLLDEERRNRMNATAIGAALEAQFSRRTAVSQLATAGAAFIASTITGCAMKDAAATKSNTNSLASFSRKEKTMTQASPIAESNALTVALVHGAFADSSSWNGVIELLHSAGIATSCPPNPLRGIAHDAAYVASFLKQIPGRVLLVGHSYGGAVITNAGSRAANVVGLVYVAAFAPDEGETLLEVEEGSRDSVLFSALKPLQYPTGNGTETATEFTILPDKIQEAFAADLSAEQNAIIASTQRPIAEVSFAEPTTAPAWKSLPSWAVIPSGDKAVGTDVVRFYAERAGSTITEVEGSHVIMVSQPQAVVDVILDAVAAVSPALAMQR
jgi:pimeloyl-ACP methyl ester carboxylesterase